MAAHVCNIGFLPAILLAALSLTACSGDMGTSKTGKLDPSTSGTVVRDENLSGSAAVPPSGIGKDYGTPRPGRVLDPSTSGAIVRDENLSGSAAVPPSGIGKDYGTPRPGRVLDPSTSGQEMDRTAR